MIQKTKNNNDGTNTGVQGSVVSNSSKGSDDVDPKDAVSAVDPHNLVSDKSGSDVTIDKGLEANRPNDPSGLLGAAVWLMLSSGAHKHLFVTDFEWLVVPPILAKQFRLFRRNNVPVGFISWALLDDEVEARIINGSVKLAPNEWTIGKKFWIIDVIAPFGGGDDMLKDLKKNVFKDEVVKYIQADEDGRRVELLK